MLETLKYILVTLLDIRKSSAVGRLDLLGANHECRGRELLGGVQGHAPLEDFEIQGL